MKEPRPFAVEMLEQWARDRGYRPLTDGDGNLLVGFRAEAHIPPIDCWLSAARGRDLAVMRCYARDARPFDEAAAATACDAWNRTHWWPKAYTYAPRGTTEIVLEGCLVVQHGATEEWIGDFLDAHLRGTFEFWEELAVATRLQAA